MFNFTPMVVALAVSVAFADTFIVVHALDGAEIVLNTKHIAGMNPLRGESKRLMHEDAKCVITLSNGRFTGIKETCAEVHKMINEAHHQ